MHVLYSYDNEHSVIENETENKNKNKKEEILWICMSYQGENIDSATVQFLFVQKKTLSKSVFVSLPHAIFFGNRWIYWHEIFWEYLNYEIPRGETFLNS